MTGFGPPAVRPETQEARGLARSSEGWNPNYVRILNALPRQKGLVKWKRAENLVKRGRAKWVGDDLQLIVSTAEAATVQHARDVQDAGYDAIKAGFKRYVGTSGGAWVWKMEKGPTIWKVGKGLA